MQLIYHVPPKSQVKKFVENKLPKEEEDVKSLEEIIFASKVSYLSKIRSKEEMYRRLSKELLQEDPLSVPLLSELLSFSKETKTEGDISKEAARVNEIQKVRSLLSTSN